MAFDTNGKLADSKVCEVGKPPQSLILNGGQEYTIIIYSFNSSKEPPIISNINDKISYNFADDTKEFLYRKIGGDLWHRYAPVGGETTLDITLRQKFAQIKFILDTRNLSVYNNQDIIIDDVKLYGIHYDYGVLHLREGYLDGYGGDGRNISIPLRKKSSKLYESDYIPVALGRSNKGRIYVRLSAPSQYGMQKYLKTNSMYVSFGRKETYTIKLSGIANNTISHIRPLSGRAYGVGATKFPQGYNPDVWDSDDYGGSFSVAKMKKTGKFFPTTGFKGATFDIIGSGDEQYDYRCSLENNSKSWVKLTSNNEYRNVGYGCRIVYNTETKPTSPVTIILENKIDGNWVKVGDYTINIPDKWAYVVDDSFYRDNSGGEWTFPTLDYCRTVGPRADYKKTTNEENDNEGDALRRRYLYHSSEITNSPNGSSLNGRYSRDIDGTFMGEWGNFNTYLKEKYEDEGDVWTYEQYGVNQQRVIKYDGAIDLKDQNLKGLALCRGE